MLEFNKISLARGKKVLLNEASCRIERRYRVGMVGRNGTGKSSLIKLLLGELSEDGGQINRSIPLDDIAYLEQSLPQTSLTVLEFTQQGDKEWHALQQKLLKAEALHDGLAIAECHGRLQEIDGYSIESRAATVLTGLGFTHEDIQQPVSQFSGGWQMRIQLARVLLSRSELYLLDEPTNHLDINAIMWLENWLNSMPATLLLISHDRDFLDNVCTHTLHLSQQKLKLYTGNYTAFAKQFQLQLEVQAKEQDKLNEKRAHLQRFVDRFRAKASKAKQAQSRVKALEKLVTGPSLQQEQDFHFEFLEPKEIQGTILNFNGSAGYDNTPLIQDCRLNVDYGDRIGIIGANGQGKTTLLKTLAGVLTIVSGQIDRHNKTNIGYFSQQQLDMLDPDASPMDTLLACDNNCSTSHARQYLGRFDFSGDRVFNPIGNFSGGEKARLALAMLIYHQPNCLLLDEPTNHLDIPMREAFILALQQYPGAVILVSHDRHFVSSIVDEIWCVAHHKVTRITGDLEDYKRGILDIAPSTPKTTTPSPAVVKKDKKIDYRQLKKIESRIDKITQRIAELEEALGDASLYEAENKDRLHELVIEHKHSKEKLEQLEALWLDCQ